MLPVTEPDYGDWKNARVNSTQAAHEIHEAISALSDEGIHMLSWIGCNKAGMSHSTDRYGRHDYYDYLAYLKPDGGTVKVFNFHGYIGDKKEDVAKYMLGAQPGTLGRLLGRFSPSVYAESPPMQDWQLNEVQTLIRELPCLDWIEGDIYNRRVQGDQIRYNCRHNAIDPSRKLNEDYWVSLGDLGDDQDQHHRTLFSRLFMAMSPRNVLSIIEDMEKPTQSSAYDNQQIS